MRRSPWSSAATALAGVLVLVAVAGCGSSQDGDVRGVADAFYAAIGSDDGGTACAALAPNTRRELQQSAKAPCPRAILSEEVPAADGAAAVQVFGTMAQVRYADDTVFLSRFRFGWRVLAAACVPQAHGPYDCRIKGG
ncbi:MULTISPECIES: hypothetical protein [unclassified Nocardioides]|uniref:hypothetical protein n=1 Tax=unclassified Nocardioides TaxID=2615069 RepID=UPI0003018BA2|nr:MULTISPECIES: hypothetical protein [unclassified Nocardioides]